MKFNIQNLYSCCKNVFLVTQIYDIEDYCIYNRITFPLQTTAGVLLKKKEKIEKHKNGEVKGYA